MRAILPQSVLLIFILLMCITGCHIIEDPEEMPVYIRADDVKVFYDRPSETGRGAPNVTDVWISINDEQLGVYHLPKIFPALPEGRTSFTVSARAGIRVNGISATRTAYPFYSTWDTTVSPDIFDTVTIKPRVTYSQNTIVPWIADYESTGTAGIIMQAPNSDVEMQRQPNNGEDGGPYPHKGNFYGKGTAAPGDFMYLIVGSNRFLDNPRVATPVFLEMEYDATFTFEVHLRYTDVEGAFRESRIMQLNPTRSSAEPVKWNKIYIDFSDKVMEPQLNVDKYAISLRASIPTNTSEAEFRFDNVKFVTR